MIASYNQSEWTQFFNKNKEDKMQQNITDINICFEDVNPLKIYFSNINKHPKLKISQDGQIVIDSSLGSKKFIACDPAIPSQGIHQFTFLINQFGAVYIGICILDKINIEKYYLDIWSKINHGTYLLCNDGFVFSNHSQQENKVETHLKFQYNDKITVEVNQEAKTITWKKLGTNEIFVLNIQ
ncbi:unnamed protein product [Paramecium pentaurelia]|uniref:Uncharacterized protein n=1 Tax=Paramecium pentaurelia TaxID=43138 RepID=A0A8S1TTC6_9CILI|nr:unnamed protein product [Paramecium pentaurelia]